LLAIIHTGHKFDSWLGITLTAVMLLVVVSGFAVRYLLTYVAHEITDKLALLQTARGDLDSAWGVLENSPAEMRALPKAPVLAAGLASLGLDLPSSGPAAEVTRIAESVADLEYAVRMHEFFKRWFGRSLKLHIVLSVILYLLLALHIGSGIYFGLRWLQ
jgi:type IV secretory pathway VirB6-like protein